MHTAPLTLFSIHSFEGLWQPATDATTSIVDLRSTIYMVFYSINDSEYPHNFDIYNSMYKAVLVQEKLECALYNSIP